MMDENTKKELDKDTKVVDEMCSFLRESLSKLGYQSMIVAAKIVEGEEHDNMKMQIVNGSSLKVMATAINELFKTNKKLPLMVALEAIDDGDRLENKLEKALDAISSLGDDDEEDSEPKNKTLQ